MALRWLVFRGSGPASGPDSGPALGPGPFSGPGPALPPHGGDTDGRPGRSAGAADFADRNDGGHRRRQPPVVLGPAPGVTQHVERLHDPQEFVTLPGVARHRRLAPPWLIVPVRLRAVHVRMVAAHE